MYKIPRPTLTTFSFAHFPSFHSMFVYIYGLKCIYLFMALPFTMSLGWVSTALTAHILFVGQGEGREGGFQLIAPHRRPSLGVDKMKGNPILKQPFIYSRKIPKKRMKMKIQNLLIFSINSLKSYFIISIFMNKFKNFNLFFHPSNLYFILLWSNKL